MLRTLLITTTLLFFLACGSGSEKNADSTETETSEATDTPTMLDPSLQLVWETDTVLTTNESVLYDADDDVLYVSNIAGNPEGKDGVGFISKLTPQGEIIELEWINGLDAPKGMAISGGKLFVTDIDRLIEIDLASAEISNTYAVENASFLNDAVADGSEIYFTDSATGKVHVLRNGSVETVIDNLDRPNGLAIATDGTLLGLDNSGFLSLGDNREIMNDVVTGGDGLIVIDEDTFIASRWQGEIYLIDQGQEYLLLDTKAQQSNTADIGFLPDQNIIVVPTFFKNRVVAYKLNY